MELFSLNFVVLLGIVFFLTIVQSLFGVGLLVFGTPTLLLLDYTFYETLSFLLPSSVTVSFLQFFKNKNRVLFYRKLVFLYCLPMVFLGLLIVIFVSNFNLDLVVGLMLITTFLLRFFKSLSNLVQNFFRKYFRFGFVLMGFLHGLTNLGGALLVIITNGIYKDKKDIQSNIAFVYMLMASIQLSLLLLTKNLNIDLSNIILAFISGVTFWNLGKLVFERTNEATYQVMMTIFILIYGLLLVLKGFIL